MSDLPAVTFGETIEAACAELKRAGYTASLGVAGPEVVACRTCGRRSGAAEVHMDRLLRIEGLSDPADEVAVAGVACPACDAHGALVLSYGPTASAEDASVLAALQDDRVRGPM